MNKKHIQDLLSTYQSTYPIEMEYRAQMLQFLATHDNFYSRKNFAGHITVSAWLLSPYKQQALMIHHQKLDRWLQMGGHIEEEDTDIFATAVREIKEESNITKIELLSDQIFDIDIHSIPENKKEPAHLHYDIRLLYRLNANYVHNYSNEEVSEIKFFSLEELVKYWGNELSIQRMAEKTSPLNK